MTEHTTDAVDGDETQGPAAPATELQPTSTDDVGAAQPPLPAGEAGPAADDAGAPDLPQAAEPASDATEAAALDGTGDVAVAATPDAGVAEVAPAGVAPSGVGTVAGDESASPAAAGPASVGIATEGATSVDEAEVASRSASPVGTTSDEEPRVDEAPVAEVLREGSEPLTVAEPSQDATAPVPAGAQVEPADAAPTAPSTPADSASDLASAAGLTPVPPVGTGHEQPAEVTAAAGLRPASPGSTGPSFAEAAAGVSATPAGEGASAAAEAYGLTTGSRLDAATAVAVDEGSAAGSQQPAVDGTTPEVAAQPGDDTTTADTTGSDSTAPDTAADVTPTADQTADVTPTADQTAADVTPTADETAAAGSPAPATAAGPRPTPRPTPRPVPRPAPRAPQAPAAAGTPAPPVAPPQDAAEAALASTFGRVDEEGTVYVREASGERPVGQFPGATADEALALYVRRYLDLHAKVVLFEARLSSADLPPKEVDQTLAKLTEELTEPAAVGDLDGLRTRLDGLRAVAAERRAAADAERAAAKEAAVAARTEIVEQAEKIAATDPERIQWRPAGEQLRVLLDQWKDAQRNGPRIDRPTEESLWKRFSHARTTFDRERRHFFAELESRNASARAAKEALVAQAEKLSTSTDWGATAGAYRDLMAQWKASGRASRKEDDALWARFRAAQDAFFAARDAASAETDAQFRDNLTVKEGLLAEAERLVPVKDLPAAKAALRSIQDRWDAAGKVPRGDLQRVEARLRAVETAIRDADQSAWTRGNPETRARAEGAAAQLEAAIAGLQADLTAAQAAGDARRIAEAQAALDARRAWLEQVRRAAQGS